MRNIIKAIASKEMASNKRAQLKKTCSSKEKTNNDIKLKTNE